MKEIILTGRPAIPCSPASPFIPERPCKRQSPHHQHDKQNYPEMIYTVNSVPSCMMDLMEVARLILDQR